jgi:hypothetical protein
VVRATAFPIRQRIENANLSIKEIQFYNDQKVTLRRELESGKTQVESGKVKLENGKYIHYIYLQQYTPGICKEISPNALDLSFEKGSGRILTFGTPEVMFGPSERPYQLQAIEWKDGIGKILYDNDYYYIQPRGSEAKLKIKKSVLNKIKVEKRTMKGLRIE